IPAAYLAGMAKNSFKSSLFFYSLSLMAILLSGTAVLSLMIGLNSALAVGFYPFLIGEAAKVMFAASSMSLKSKWFS
ncbi:MAG: biotin transporter BioY, partial [Parachlamydiaceae bacterium]